MTGMTIPPATTSSAPAPSRTAIAFTLLRLIVGIVFIMHGTQKVMAGHEAITGGFTGMGVPLPSLSAFLITWLEFLGGIALVFGLITRVVAILLACDMLGAILLVHGKNGFFLPTGFEFAMLMCTACIALALAGGGAASLDGILAGRRSQGSLG
jgi:putative oxidoreductase